MISHLLGAADRSQSFSSTSQKQTFAIELPIFIRVVHLIFKVSLLNEARFYFSIFAAIPYSTLYVVFIYAL